MTLCQRHLLTEYICPILVQLSPLPTLTATVIQLDLDRFQWCSRPTRSSANSANNCVNNNFMWNNNLCQFFTFQHFLMLPWHLIQLNDLTLALLFDALSLSWCLTGLWHWLAFFVIAHTHRLAPCTTWSARSTCLQATKHGHIWTDFVFDFWFLSDWLTLE